MGARVFQLRGLDAVAGESVREVKARIPVSGDLYGDIGRSSTAIAEMLTKKGYLAYARAIQTGEHWWTGSPIYGQVEVQLQKKGGATFDAATAKADIAAASNSIGLKIGLLKDWIVQIAGVANPLTIGSNAGQGAAAAAGAVFDAAADAKKKYDACVAAGGNPVICAGGGVGIPKWVWWAGAALVVGGGGLYVLNSVVGAKKAFFGDAPKRKARKKKRCPDCGEAGERKGHMGCQYPSDHENG